MTNIFEKASRLKLRFESEKGNVSVGELWQYPLEKVNEMAVALAKYISEKEQFSFLPTATSTGKPTENALRLDILKHVISTRVQEKEDSAKRSANHARLQQLKELATQKANEALSQQSLADIQKQIDALEAQLV